MMAGHLDELAAAVKDALEASGELDTAARALLDAAGPSDDWRAVDVGAGLYIAIKPGFGPLDVPSAFVELVHVVA